MKDIYFIYNPQSGSALPLGELKARCKDAGLVIKKFIPIDANIRRRLERPIAGGSTLAVLGGDGTINSIVNIVAGTQAILAPLSGGTFNHFVGDAGIPQDLDMALKRLISAKVRRIDTVMANGTYFVNNSLLGLYPYSLEVRGELEGKYGKWPAVIAGVVISYIHFHTYHIEIDGTKYRTPFVFVGNNNFGLERLGLPGRSRLDGNIMCVYIARAHTRIGVAKLFLRAFTGKLKDDQEFEALKITNSVKVVANTHYLRVSHDGELSKMKTPITYTLKPKSLRIL